MASPLVHATTHDALLVRSWKAVFDNDGGMIVSLQQRLPASDQIDRGYYTFGHTLVVAALAVMAEDDASAAAEYKRTIGRLLAQLLDACSSARVPAAVMSALAAVRSVPRPPGGGEEADVAGALAPAQAHVRRILCELPTPDSRTRFLMPLATAHARYLPLLQALWAEGASEDEVGPALLLAAIWWCELDMARELLRRVPLGEDLVMMVVRAGARWRSDVGGGWESVRFLLQQSLPEDLILRILRESRHPYNDERDEVLKQLVLAAVRNHACSREAVRSMVWLPSHIKNGVALAFADLAMDARDVNAMKEVVISLAHSVHRRRP